MAYVIATTETVLRWYAFNPNQRKGALNDPLRFELLARLDLEKVMQADDKATAKH